MTGGYLAAATVIAGGALEMHLKSYCDNHGLSVAGAGAISAYNGAVGQARKTTPGLYNANDGKLVESLGGQRNEAAHAPGSFARSKEEVGRTISGFASSSPGRRERTRRARTPSSVSAVCGSKGDFMALVPRLSRNAVEQIANILCDELSHASSTPCSGNSATSPSRAGIRAPAGP